MGLLDLVVGDEYKRFNDTDTGFQDQDRKEHPRKEDDQACDGWVDLSVVVRGQLVLVNPGVRHGARRWRLTRQFSQPVRRKCQF